MGESINQTIAAILGESVLGALYAHLQKFHDITPAEIPYRLDTLSSALEKTFGTSFNTIEKAAAKRLYSNLGLEFEERPGHRLIDYVESAKVTYARLHESRTLESLGR